MLPGEFPRLHLYAKPRVFPIVIDFHPRTPNSSTPTRPDLTLHLALETDVIPSFSAPRWSVPHLPSWRAGTAAVERARPLTSPSLRMPQPNARAKARRNVGRCQPDKATNNQKRWLLPENHYPAIHGSSEEPLRSFEPRFEPAQHRGPHWAMEPNLPWKTAENKETRT